MITNDGGKNWIQKKIGNLNGFGKMAYPRLKEKEDDRKCFLIAADGAKQKLIVTNDYGENWEIFPKEFSTVHDINFYNSKYGVITTYKSNILITSDGGITWKNYDFPNAAQFNSVFIYDTLFISAGGAYGTFSMTQDGGKTWSTRTIDTNCYIDGIWFTNKQKGFLLNRTTNGRGSFLSKTTNGGENWIKQNSVASLNKIFFLDEKNGYVIGSSYLYTTDGGENWNEDPNISGYSIHFANKNVGTIIGMDGSILRTTNGGMTFAEKQKESPKSINLLQNYPNPFNPSTVISYSVGAQGLAPVQIKIFDILGREVRTLIDEYKPAGEHKVTFDAKGLSGGVYFYRLSAGGKMESRKMILVK